MQAKNLEKKTLYEKVYPRSICEAYRFSDLVGKDLKPVSFLIAQNLLQKFKKNNNVFDNLIKYSGKYKKYQTHNIKLKNINGFGTILL